MYLPPNIIWVIRSRRMRWTVYVARMKERRVAYRFLVRKSERKSPLRRHRCRWKDKIKMDPRVVG
jgi:hypothetical protein